MSLSSKIIAIAVTIIIISTVALPIIEDMRNSALIPVYNTNTEEQFTVSNAADPVSLSISYSDGKVLVNDYSFTPSTYSLFIVSDSFVLRYNGANQKFVATSVDDTTQYTLETATIASNTLSFTDSSEADHSWTYSDYLIYPSDGGKYGYFIGTGTTFTANKDVKVYTATTRINATNSDLSPSACDICGVFSGTNGVLTPEWMEVRTSGITTADLTITIPGYTDNGDGTYTIVMETGTVTVVTDVGDYSYSLVANNFGYFAPIQYYVMGETDLSNLIGIIPLLLILIPVMIAVKMIVAKRN